MTFIRRPPPVRASGSTSLPPCSPECCSELGYLSHAADAASVLYRVVNERYLAHRPMLLTTSKLLAALGTVLHDGDLTEAILDRLLERGAHFAMRGRSYRTRHLTKEEDPTERPANPA